MSMRIRRPADRTERPISHTVWSQYKHQRSHRVIGHDTGVRCCMPAETLQRYLLVSYRKIGVKLVLRYNV